MDVVRTVETAVAWLRERLPADFSPACAVTLGTGLGGLGQAVELVTSIPYSDIPGCKTPTVDSHGGTLLAGTLHGRRVLFWQGRFHLYEGFSPAEIAFGVRVSALLGAKVFIATNVSGAINPQFSTGSIMAITDHVNLMGQSPLTGDNHEAWGPRFPDMSRVYSPRLIDLALRKGLEAGLRLERGVYVGVLGPQLETPAETRFFRGLGDAIGMSTLMEVIAAKHMGLEILGLSCLVNKNLPDCMGEVSLEDILAEAVRSEKALSTVVEAVIRDL
ncbi:purine-nucleoside phosphorylase [Fundidesulfovibrio butyratiphilus]